MNNEQTKPVKTRKSHKPVYPDYISLEMLDAVIKSGKDPITMMAEMKKALMERVLEAELDHHLSHAKHAQSQDGNYRNGHGKKSVLMDDGTVEISTPRDRNGEFEPILLPKRQRHFKGFDDKIISMYGMGMSTRDIAAHLHEMYAIEVSHELIANVTDAVLDEVKTWQMRPLDAIYPILYLDAMVIKVRDGKQIINKSLYIAMGVNMEGNKEILGLWLASSEGAKFWLSVLNELKNRGVKDILIACCDGLTGFPEAINATFPKTTVQLCIVHMIRNSLKFVSYKDYKAVTADLKQIYGAASEEQALEALIDFQAKWDSKYPMIGQSWQRHWQEITPFLQYPDFIKRAIYTTNIIEASNRQVRKVIKTKGSFPNDDAVYKIVFLALQKAQKKWTIPIKEWQLALNQFCIFFPNRVQI
jgi:putative transposase